METTKILVIRFRRIGDAILTVALINSLKKTIPNAEIHYVLNDHIADIFTENPNIAKLIRFTKDDYSSFFKYIKKVHQVVKQEKYDLIIDTRTTINTLFFALFSLKTKYRIGQCKPYNHLIHNKRVDIDLNTSFISQKIRLLAPLADKYTIKEDPTFDLFISEDNRQNFRKYMERSGIDFTKPVMLCTAVTRVVSKCWRSDWMQEILHKIIEKDENIQIIFNYGDMREKELSNQIFKEMGQPRQIFVNVEANSLNDLTTMVANCDFLFGNEGGTRHISQALNIPSFAIYSPGNSIDIWLPNRSDRYDGISCTEILSDEELKKMTREEQFNSITVEKVWEQLCPKLDRYLSKRS